jgi:hypothetical protein
MTLLVAEALTLGDSRDPSGLYAGTPGDGPVATVDSGHMGDISYEVG